MHQVKSGTGEDGEEAADEEEDKKSKVIRGEGGQKEYSKYPSRIRRGADIRVLLALAKKCF